MSAPRMTQEDLDRLLRRKKGAAATAPPRSELPPPGRQVLVIPGRFPALNEILESSKTHWSVYREEKETYTTLVKVAAQQAGLCPVSRPVKVTFFWVEKNKKRDKDNLRAGAKFVLDGLVEAGVLPGDGWRWVQAFEDLFGVDAENPRVEVTIEELV